MKLLKNLSILLTGIASLLSLAIPLTMAPTFAQAQTVSSNFCYTFSTNLGEGRYMSPQDAAALTTALTDAGVWTSGTPITNYSDTVASAVSGFQEKYAAEILTPNGLTYGTGYVGASTRAELNSLFACSTTTTATSATGSSQCPAGYTCVPTNPNPAPVCPAGFTCTPVNSNPCLTGDYSYCGSQVTTSANSPTLSSVTPYQASANQIVTLTGSNFSGSTEVHISNTSGVDLSIPPSSVASSGTSLSFSLPATVSQGPYTISVYNITGTNESSNGLSFIVLPSTQTTYSTTAVTSAPQSGPGSMLITQGSLSNTSTNPGKTMVPILNATIQAQGSNIMLQNVTVDLGSNTALFNSVYSTLYLVDSSTGNVLVTMPLNPSSVIQNGSNYILSFILNNFVIPEGTSKNLTVEATLYNSQINTSSLGIMTIKIDPNSIRGVDSNGINTYGPSTAISQSITVTAQSGQTSNNAGY